MNSITKPKKSSKVPIMNYSNEYPFSTQASDSPRTKNTINNCNQLFSAISPKKPSPFYDKVELKPIEITISVTNFSKALDNSNLYSIIYSSLTNNPIKLQIETNEEIILFINLLLSLKNTTFLNNITSIEFSIIARDNIFNINGLLLIIAQNKNLLPKFTALSFLAIYQNITLTLPDALNHLTALTFGDISNNVTLILPKTLINLTLLSFKNIFKEITISWPQKAHNLTSLIFGNLFEDTILTLPNAVTSNLISLAFGYINQGATLTFPNTLSNFTSLTFTGISEQATITWPQRFDNLTSFHLGRVSSHITFPDFYIAQQLTSFTCEPYEPIGKSLISL